MSPLLPFLLLLLLFYSQSRVDSLNEEGLALLSFKHSIQDPQGSLSNWNNSDQNPCSWSGVTCKDQKVVSLRIPKKKLSGLLSSTLGSLSHLRHVNLRSNRLFGPLPVQLFQALGLQSLVLEGNYLSGSLSSDIGKLTYLQNLDLSQNLLNGSIPTSILQCKRLRAFDVSGNNLTGPIPQGFGANLASLENLNLSCNKFNGSIPSDMGNLSSLQGTVDLSHNLFSGSIPASLGDLPEKVYIYNNLSGLIPQSGAMVNRGPTAFIGNPLLCGSPLKTQCSSDEGPSSSDPSTPNTNPAKGYRDKAEMNKGRGLTRNVVVGIIGSDIVGICLIGLLFSYCYTRVVCPRAKAKGEGEYGFAKADYETQSRNVEHHDLVALDMEVGFGLDELLKASAFVLGKSGIGIVYKVVLEGGVALAVRRLGEGGSQRFEEFETEAEAIGKLRHPNVATLRAYYWCVDEKLLIYEYVPNGSLATALHGKPGMSSSLPWSTRLAIMRDTAKGLVYLHEFSPKKYVHGDLKPSNILLGANMDPKISDFGLGRLATIAEGGAHTLQSSRITMTSSDSSSIISTTGSALAYYQAPESVKSMKASQKWDVYSYGVILMEVVTGRSPLVQGGASEVDHVQWIRRRIDAQKPLADVLEPCLVQEADKGDEMVAALKIAVACVHTSPEKRPAMRHVYDALDRLTKTSD